MWVVITVGASRDDTKPNPLLSSNLSVPLPTGRYPDVKIAESLIRYGANVRHRTRRRTTALHGASLLGNIGPKNFSLHYLLSEIIKC